MATANYTLTRGSHHKRACAANARMALHASHATHPALGIGWQLDVEVVAGSAVLVQQRREARSTATTGHVATRQGRLSLHAASLIPEGCAATHAARRKIKNEVRLTLFQLNGQSAAAVSDDVRQAPTARRPLC